MEAEPKFIVGQVIQHRIYNYRGVVVDVDNDFRGTDRDFAKVKIAPRSKDEPWYHVLVHRAEHTTYVPEDSLARDWEGTPVDHPLVDLFFERFEQGQHTRTLN